MREQKLYRARIADLVNHHWFVTSCRHLNDVERLVQLFSASRPNQEWTKERLRQIFDNPRIRQTFIAYDGRYDGSPIGHCSYKVEDDKPFAHWLVVDPRWTGHGVSAELISRVASVARKDGYSDLYFYYGDLRDDDHNFCVSSKFLPLPNHELDAYRKRLEELYE